MRTFNIHPECFYVFQKHKKNATGSYIPSPSFLALCKMKKHLEGKNLKEMTQINYTENDLLRINKELYKSFDDSYKVGGVFFLTFKSI